MSEDSDYEERPPILYPDDPKEPSARALSGHSLLRKVEVIPTPDKSARRIHVETAWKYRRRMFQSVELGEALHYQIVYNALRQLINDNFRRDLYRRRALRMGLYR